MKLNSLYTHSLMQKAQSSCNGYTNCDDVLKEEEEVKIQAAI